MSEEKQEEKKETENHYDRESVEVGLCGPKQKGYENGKLFLLGHEHAIRWRRNGFVFCSVARWIQQLLFKRFKFNYWFFSQTLSLSLYVSSFCFDDAKVKWREEKRGIKNEIWGVFILRQNNAEERKNNDRASTQLVVAFSLLVNSFNTSCVSVFFYLHIKSKTNFTKPL